MTTIAQDEPRPVTGGVDTHKDVHVAAVLDAVGRLIATASFPTTRHGYRRMLRWLQSHGELASVGIEGCGSWGAGLARYLTERNVTVVEVNRPNRQNRRLHGKSDTVDAEAAARAVLNGQANVTPKAGAGPVEAVRQLRNRPLRSHEGPHRRGQPAPQPVRHRTRPHPRPALRRHAAQEGGDRRAVAARHRHDRRGGRQASSDDRRRRWRTLDDEACELSRHIKAILDDIAAPLLAVHGVGYETAGQLLVTAGDNPERLGHEKSFAALCGSSPIQASSGRTTRHRLNRGGDRHANSALWTIVLVRMGNHPPTKGYVARRTAEGLSKPEIMRCLKRYVARELYPLIQAITASSPLEQGDATGSQIAA